MDRKSPPIVQEDSYELVRRISTDKRPCVYLFNSTCLRSRQTGQVVFGLISLVR
jgi:hypothetical protein